MRCTIEFRRNLITWSLVNETLQWIYFIRTFNIVFYITLFGNPGLFFIIFTSEPFCPEQSWLVLFNTRVKSSDYDNKISFLRRSHPFRSEVRHSWWYRSCRSRETRLRHDLFDGRRYIKSQDSPSGVVLTLYGTLTEEDQESFPYVYTLIYKLIFNYLNTKNFR